MSKADKPLVNAFFWYKHLKPKEDFSALSPSMERSRAGIYSARHAVVGLLGFKNLPGLAS